MGYVAVKGGETAIINSKNFYFSKLKKADEITEEAVNEGLTYLVDKIMSEGSLYSESLAAKAVKKSGGEPLNAAFYLRAHRSTCKRAGECEEIRHENIRIIRKISSAFKDIPGGQILGPSSDYILRLFTTDKDVNSEAVAEISDNNFEMYQPSAVDMIRNWGVVKEVTSDEEEPFDVTRVNPQPPYRRSAGLQIMSRGETGAMLAFAYTSMRGYGDVHPTVGDLRIGYADVEFTHPVTGKKVKVGEMRTTSCEMVSVTTGKDKTGKDTLMYAVGYGFCFGFNETKAISMGILDSSMSSTSYSTGGVDISSNPELVLNHIDGIESYGFCNHYKLPHYVTFQADLKLVKAGHERECEEGVNEK